MPRDLADVLHHLLPDAPAEKPADAPASDPLEAQGDRGPSAPIIGVPIGDSDVVRAAFVWNLAIELARRGSPATLLGPETESDAPLWPARERGVLGCQTRTTRATHLGELAARAQRTAHEDAQSHRRAIVVVRVPPAWIEAEQEPSLADADEAPSANSPDLLDWSLFLCSPEDRELADALRSIERVATTRPHARLGVTIHGAQRVADARDAFERLARACESHLGREIVSYGMLVDDLHVYRAIVGQRPIGLAHPQSAAAAALADVARLIDNDAHSEARDGARG